MLVVIGSVVLIGDLVWVARHTRQEARGVQEPVLSQPSMTAIVLLVANVLFVVVLGIHVVEEGSATPGGRGPDPSKSGPVEAELLRDPAAHLPLAGMDGFDGNGGDACDRLLGFLFNMSEAIVRKQRVPPMMQPDIQQLADQTRCTLGEPDVQDALQRFAVAYEGAGLAPLAPFALVGQTLPDPDRLLSAHEASEGAESEDIEVRCEKLGLLFVTMREDLIARSGTPPLTEAQERVLCSGSCLAADPSVQVGLHLYRSAYESAGLAPNADLMSAIQVP